MNKKVILLVLLAVVAIAAFVGYRMYNEKTPQAAEKKADVVVDAEALFQAFSKDEIAAGKTYNDKVVQVNGTIREMTVETNAPTNVLLETSDAMAAVVCEFAPGSVPAAWKKGDKVTLKGFCAGFNMDVLLQRCSTVE